LRERHFKLVAHLQGFANHSSRLGSLDLCSG
jgi:hypothetical protein